MKDNKKSDRKLKDIAFSNDSRPYWTYQNRSGNTGPHLTNKELRKLGLSRFKKYPYSKIWAISVKLGNYKKLTIWEDIYVKWKSRKNIKWTWKKIFTKWERTIPRWVENQPKE